MIPLLKHRIQEQYPKNIIGVYAVFFREWNEIAYFGSSKNIRARLLSHANALGKGKHKNFKLSKLYKRYHQSCWCTLVKVCETEEEARVWEQIFIDFDPRASMNVDRSVYTYKRK
tara:strand:+ start:827 stop:1171 length:345 start_codon:yes stop_codon:yes gene_type:complete